jgi:hypothetical protein
MLLATYSVVRSTRSPSPGKPHPADRGWQPHDGLAFAPFCQLLAALTPSHLHLVYCLSAPRLPRSYCSCQPRVLTSLTPGISVTSRVWEGPPRLALPRNNSRSSTDSRLNFVNSCGVAVPHPATAEDVWPDYVMFTVPS